MVAATLSVGLLPSTEGAAPAPAVSAPGSAAVAAGAADLGFAVQLGPEQRVTGPTNQGDNPFFSEKRGTKLYAYFGTSRTIEWRFNGRLTNPRIILNRGGAGKFDECGAWMQGSIQKITAQRWVAFYHAEGKGPGSDDCDHYGDTTVWRMARAVTTNGGKTWRRPGYPNNVVVAGVGATASTGVTNAGTGRVVKVGDYFYMFFKTAHGPKPGPSGIQVARSPVSSEGAPGSWKKYFCHPATILQPAYCAFDENGIGGKSTQIGGISEKARYIAWNSALNRWIGFDASGARGFRLFASEVGTGATADARQADALFDGDGNPKRWMNYTDTYPLVSTENDPYVDQWGGHIRNRRSKQLYAYPSIGGLDGNSWLTGSQFYVYYVKLFPGDKFTHRYLFRRKVTVVPNSDAFNRVELTLYRNGTGQRRSSTEAPKEKAFRRVGATGYLLSHGATGWKQVFDCVRRGDHALFAERCKTGWRANRRVGFIRPRTNDVATVPVYRCFAKRSHYVSTSPGCGGGKREARIGFALTSL
ncbi:hypothetical protein SFC88_19890 [Nocardioides sp. HM23]|uniref:hypothetical protein n=1 Tax=Nocardioides bizhenqiangii TaxID=3095076 RepID=UPI002ACA06B7|nr:hypothetical protein [Nocardioides sp. HM23]MDZ5623111.1 hypothetical protein [Nocardioides sp. HM23]